MHPWNQEQIDKARQAPVPSILDYLGAYYKVDTTYVPLDPTRKSVRVQVGYKGNDFRFIFTGAKWVNELSPEGHSVRGGGGTIDFVIYLTRLGFVEAVRICLEAANRGQK